MLESIEAACRDSRSTTTSVTQIAVIIPCLNEATTINQVVRDFREVLPRSRVIVIDNGSTDETERIARAAGAEVLVERRKGKGYALLTGFLAASEAELFVMVDGDGTYLARDAPALIAASQRADMVIGTRLMRSEGGAFPAGHTIGNRLFGGLVRVLFGLRTRDLFSGFRVVRRSMLEASPLIAQGFEVEAELSLQALARGFQVGEVEIEYLPRPPGSLSKLRTVRDGVWILVTIFAFLRDYKPITFFGSLSLGCMTLSLAGGTVVVTEYVKTGLVPRLPLAVLSMGLFLLSTLLFTVGILLSSINRRAAELAAMIRWRRG